MPTQFKYGIGLAAVTAVLAGSVGADNVPIGEDTYHRYEWRASTFEPSGQAQTAVDVMPDGTILATWSSRRQQDGHYGVYAQRFTPQGVALGSETCLNLWTNSHQWLPDVAAGTADGPTWAVWQSHDQDGYGGSIVGRTFDGDFEGSSEILVNQQWEGHQQAPVVAVSPQNTAAVAWVTANSENTGLEIHTRLFAADGSPLGDEFAISETAGCTHMPAVAFAADGTFAMAYALADENMAPLGIRMQRFDAAGNPIGEAIDVCGEVRESQIEPVIAALQDGYVVAWLDGETDGDDYGVLARRFDTEGCPLDEFALLVNSRTKGLQNAIAIAVASQGHYAIAYNSSDGEDMGIFAKMFTPNGVPIGREFRINSYTEKKQAMREACGTRRLAFGPAGELVCAWSGNGGFNDRSSANITMLTPKPLELAGARQGVTGEMEPSRFATADLEGDALAKPHEPPVFDPKTIRRAERKVVTSGRNIGFTAITNTGWTPPDPHLAVGPNHVVVMTNGGIAFYTKDGTQTFFDEIEDSFGFWGGEGATGFVFDPETFYDPLAALFAMAAEAYVGSKSYVLIAVSDDSDPNGTWYKYRLDTSGYAGNLFDSPNIAVDDEALYITGDGFGLGANYPVYIYDKDSFLVGNQPVISNSFLLSTSTQSAGIPSVTYDDPPALYMIEHQEGSGRTQVRLLALQDPLGTPTITDTYVTVPSYSSPGDPQQKGTSTRPETFDARFWSAAYRADSIWATQHINSSPVLARWYEIKMNGWPDSGLQPELVQSGDINPGDGVHTFFCSIDIDGNGNAAMTVARSSAEEYISMRTAYRLASDPLGTFRPDESQAESNGPYYSARWGDYSGTRWDPVDPGRFWAFHEFAVNGSWQTWVAGIDTCRAADVDCNGVVNIDDVFAILAAWGPCPGCPEDVDGSGVVDIDDLFAVLADWG